MLRGLVALVEGSEEFFVVASARWDEPVPELGFALILGELEPGEELPYEPVVPSVVLCDSAPGPTGPGRAFLTREAEDGAIWCAMRAVLYGLSVTDAGHLGSPIYSSSLDDLTPRECELLNLLGEGYTNRQIAEFLNISPNTVKFHLSSVFSKLGVGSRAEAVTVGIRNGLIML